MAEDKVAAAAESGAGKKGKVKALDGEPENTKVQKLQKEVLEAVEKHFDKAKLRNLRVHTGGNVKDISKSIGARAFTVGEDIYFANPSDASNKEIVAREVGCMLNTGNGKMPKAQKGKAVTWW